MIFSKMGYLFQFSVFSFFSTPYVVAKVVKKVRNGNGGVKNYLTPPESDSF